MALIGAIIGDIIGSRFEFPHMRPDDLDWNHCDLFDEGCQFTDDTIMSIGTKIAFDNYMGNFEKAYREMYHLYPNENYGDMFMKWLRFELKEPYKSFGNGSAMRVSYVGDLFHDIDNVLKWSKLSVSCTHNSESGEKGAIVTASVIAMGNVGCDKSDIFDFAYKAYKGNYYNCSQSLDEIRNNYIWNEMCDLTVPVAIRCFLESTDYESCIRNCFSLPCDMDTMCCIAGGIAEAFYGTTGLDNDSILKQYLDTFLYKCIKDILGKK